MPLKNHYQTLRLPLNASQEDIKKAFRKLALQYHPDKNDTASSHKLFLEIQESYAVLSNPKKKKQYDEERYFSGLTSRKEPSQLSTEWILKLSTELRKHTTHLHSYDINHQALYQYTLLILSDVHLAFLEEEGDTIKNKEIVDELLLSISKIDFYYFENLINKLMQITPIDFATQQAVAKELLLRKKKKQLELQFPILLLLTVIMLCIVMYFYSKNR